MLPWYYQLLILMGITVVIYPVVFVLVVKFFFFPALMSSVAENAVKTAFRVKRAEDEEMELEEALNASFSNSEKGFHDVSSEDLFE